MGMEKKATGVLLSKFFDRLSKIYNQVFESYVNFVESKKIYEMIRKLLPTQLFPVIVLAVTAMFVMTLSLLTIGL